MHRLERLALIRESPRLEHALDVRQGLAVAPELDALGIGVDLLGLTRGGGHFPIHGPAVLELVVEFHLNLAAERVERFLRGSLAGVRRGGRHLLGGGFFVGGGNHRESGVLLVGAG